MHSQHRQRILQKTHGHCAHCGCDLHNQRWHIDHIQPIYRGRPESKGNHQEDNQLPACPRCNRWEKTFSVEDFRQELSQQTARLLRGSPAFNIAVDFGLIQIKTPPRPIQFYFEELSE